MTEARATIAAFLKEDPSWAIAKEAVFPTGKYPPISRSSPRCCRGSQSAKYDDLTDEQLMLRLKILTEQAASLIGRLIHQDDEASQCEDG
jgi:hypothetical protein